MISIDSIRDAFPKRRSDSHKGDFGRVLVVAGSCGYTGAAYLAAQAAVRAGSGLVTLAVPESIHGILASKLTEVMVKPFAETPERALDLDAQSELLSFAKKCSVFAVGPGLSQDKATAQLVRRIAPRLKGPIVLDADGISAFCGYTDALKKATGSGASIVLTPHPGELAKLTGRSVEDIQKSRKDIALKVACEYNIVLVLKGHGTVVADPSGKLYINDTGNPGMASGGVGDVLTGVIAAFLAQGANTFDAAVLGVYFHGLAGDIAAKEKGILSLIATDILDKLPEALRQLG
ncbi:MAG: NAD(P)H-hydrate dehydratase [Candidatus Omnitrophica bacterium]|nr:NAD(P)H-hydrate dehydratase [Candidatus Omnitrophota bacterium]